MQAVPETVEPQMRVSGNGNGWAEKLKLFSLAASMVLLYGCSREAGAEKGLFVVFFRGFGCEGGEQFFRGIAVLHLCRRVGTLQVCAGMRGRVHLL